MELATLIKEAAEYLGAGYFLRQRHPFLIPTPDGVVRRLADGVFFRSPVPSARTAAYAFVDSLGDSIEDFGYLGAPFVFATRDSEICLFEFRGSPLPEFHGSSSASGTERLNWVRGRLERIADQPQLPLAFEFAREVFIGTTKKALSNAIRNLMLSEMEDHGTSEAEAFQSAITIVREALFTGRSPASKQDDWLTFANIPPEAFAELYESLAVEAQARRRKGVVYTPSWLAQFAVSRLPETAFRSGSAADPTCGSGTFLVSFLERVVEEYADVSPNDLNLPSRVQGLDIDQVAVETARLTLDFFGRAVGLPPQDWDLHVGDATTKILTCEWVIGNLPFGYRTHKGKQDLSAVLLEHVLSTNKQLQAMAVVMPDSFAYTRSARRAREILRSAYELQEVTRLPEGAFETSHVRTMVVAARSGKPRRDLLVREVGPKHLKAFRANIYVAKTFTMKLPKESEDPWRFSPFSNVFDRAEESGVPLSEVAEIRMGLQVYGTEARSLAARGGRPLLTDPAIFARWTPSVQESLPRLVGNKEDVRRPGPWDLFPSPKVVIRATTAVDSADRLAALPDRLGIWFTDKFLGLWPRTQGPSVEALAAYLQTRFACVWFKVQNPSRKARVRVLRELPLPRLSSSWWERAASLAPANRVARPPGKDGLFSDEDVSEWQWFNEVVEMSLELPLGAGEEFQAWLSEPGDD